jgi:hypothetical protein
MKKFFTIFILFILTLTPVNSVASNTTDNCPVYDFSSLFYEEYFPNSVWKIKEISWSTNSLNIHNKDISRKFSPDEVSWVRSAIKSWDDAIDSISFKELTDPTNANINIGLVDLGQSEFGGYWYSYWDSNKIRNRAFIQINSSNRFLNEESKFIHVVQHELGNVLGLGDIRSSGDVISVLEDPLEFPYGNKTLSDLDTGLIRQLYGESTCKSTFPKYRQEVVPIVLIEKTVEPVAKIQPKVFKKEKYEIVCIKGNKKMIIYRYNKNYPCLRGYVKQ